MNVIHVDTLQYTFKTTCEFKTYTPQDHGHLKQYILSTCKPKESLHLLFVHEKIIDELKTKYYYYLPLLGPFNKMYVSHIISADMLQMMDDLSNTTPYIQIKKHINRYKHYKLPDFIVHDNLVNLVIDEHKVDTRYCSCSVQ